MASTAAEQIDYWNQSAIPVPDPPADSEAGTGAPSQSKAKVVAISGGPLRRERIPIDRLYPEVGGDSGVLGRSLRLSEAALNLVKDSAALRWRDPISSDDRMNKLLPVLKEMFCCRELGEGFAATVNGLIYSVQNNADALWTGAQMKAVLGVIDGIRSEPYLRFESALEHLDRLEEVGLLPEPREFEALGDWLDAQSLH